MKKAYILLVFVFTLHLSNAQNLLNNPESVVYDSIYDRYLVSNCGDGQIVQIDSSGQQSYFNTDLTYTLGLHIVGDTLFVSSNEGPYSGIVGFLLSSGEICFHVDIPEKELLNDITSDMSGNLYVTDCDANKIFRVNMSDMTYTTLIDNGLGYPNGILFDELNNRLLVLNCLLAGRPILSVNLDDLSLSTIVQTGISAIDGLTEDNEGNYYFSSWTMDRVYRYDAAFTNPPEIIAGGYSDPADIFYNKINDVLAIPNFSADTIIFLPITPVVVDELLPDGTGSIRIHPNPFTDLININFDLSLSSHIKVSVYDLSGKLITELINKEPGSGASSLVWDGSDMESGVYIITISGKDVYHSNMVIKR